MKKTLLVCFLGAIALSADAQYLLHNNGQFISDPGAGTNGRHVSAIQAGLSNFGFNHRRPSSIRIADDFTIPAGQTWNIDSMVFYAYQTGSPITSTINNVNIRIWSAMPGSPGATVLYGDTAINRLATSTFSGIYRTSTDFTNTDRPVMRNAITTAALTLPAGTYWVDWQSGGSLTSGPWAPPLVVPGQSATGNAVQFGSAGAWAPVLDGPNTSSLTIPQGLPFLVKGTATGVATDVSIASVTTPVNSCPNPAAQVCAVLRNYGTTAQSNIPVRYVLNNSITINEVFAGPLAPGDSATYCFTATANLGTSGAKTLDVSTQLVGDELAANNTVTKFVTIAPVPNTTLTSLQNTYCTNAANVTLNGSPAGGTYTGPGITGNVFSAAAAGVGTHTITYMATNAAGCSATVTRTVTVNTAPTSAFTLANTNNTYNFTSTSTGATTYSWNFGDGNTSTMQNPTHTYTSIGNFTVTHVATGANSCSASSTQPVSILVGISEALEKAVSLYPNPSEGAFTITLPAAETASVKVYNALGQLVKAVTNQQANELIVKLETPDNGIYLVKVEVQKQTLVRKLVIE